MPNYEYGCYECGKVFEVFLRLSEYDTPVRCECGGDTKKIISAAVHGDEAAWIRDAAQVLQTEKGERPIENRTDLLNHLKKHGLEHAG